MTKKLILLIGFFIAVQAGAQNIRYVTTTGSGTMDGSSWANASNDIQLMMDALTSGGEVWIAGGTYLPTRDRTSGAYSPGSQYNSFVMRNNVKLYGGFEGTENALAGRNLQNTEDATILSGDLLQDDVLFAYPLGYNQNNMSENAHNVVIAASDLGSIELNGITVQGGFGAYGGGLYLNDTILTLNYTNITDNAAYEGGGGIYAKNSAIIATNCRFNNNVPGEGFGGGILFDFSNGTIAQNSTFSNCVFSFNNSQTGTGGLMAYLGQGPAPAFNNCTLYSNGSEFNSPAVYYENNQNLVFNNCIIAKPVVQGEPYAFCDSPNVTFRHVLTNYISVALSADSYNNLFNTNPFFADAANNNFRIIETSLGVNNGNNSLIPAELTTDIAGTSRILGGNVDIGAYETTVASIVPDADGIVYVTANGAGDMSGNSWANATPDLARTLLSSYGNSTINKIWIGGGTFRPKYRLDNFSGGNPHDRNNTFRLTQNISIYGGFAGSETAPEQRAFLPENETILTGDLYGDDNPGFGNRSENAYHVLVLPYNTNNVRIDGVTITGGNADFPNEDSFIAPKIDDVAILRTIGGGLFARSYITLAKVKFMENYSGIDGGAINMLDAGITNSAFLHNVSGADGGAIWMGNLSTSVENSVFENNFSYGKGGVLFSNQGIVTAAGCVFSRNNSFINNGLIYARLQGGANFVNCTIADNGTSQNQHILFSGSDFQFQNCIITAPANAASGSVIVSNPDTSIFNSTLTNYPSVGTNPANSGNILTSVAGYTDSFNGNYTLSPMSPAVNNGNNTFVSLIKDIAGNDRLLFGTVDIGAYERTEMSPGPDNNGVLYVKKDGAGSQLGNSWANALPELADALYLAKFNPEIHQIWVAGGTYKPLYDPATNNKTVAGRRNTFVMVPNVKIYGGFAGTETTLAQRDLNLDENKSVLSGDFNGDDNPTNFENHTEDAFHVVVAAGELGTAELNGFTVTGGNSFSSNFSGYLVYGRYVYENGGGGIYITGSSPHICNANICNNVTRSVGGAAYIEDSGPIFTNTAFKNNACEPGIDPGGGIYISVASDLVGGTLFNNCLFYKNLSYGNGFGNELAYVSSSAYDFAPKFTNCTIIAGLDGYNLPANIAFVFSSQYSKIPEFNNCIMVRPPGDWWSAFSSNNNCQELIRNCFTNYGVISYNPGNTGSVVVADPFFTDPENGDFTLRPYSPALNIGNNAYAAGLETDIAGNPRIQNGTVDPGAFETSRQAIPQPDANGIVYVSQNATGTGEGNSWDNARTELADALLAAQFNPEVQEIWVAGGKYTPKYHPLTFDYNPADRENAFVLKAGVKLYGGFAGNEASLSERNLALTENASVLSGDFNGNDAENAGDYGYDFTTQQENAYHVVIAPGPMGDAVLDGFTVTGGHADGDASLTLNGQSIAGQYGGGLYMAGGTVSVSHAVFLYNSADERGGGLYADAQNPSITSCLFKYNVAPNGAGLYCRQASPVITNSVFHQNSASVAGGGMYFDGGTPVLTNLTIMRNHAEDGNSGAIYNSFAATAIRNTIIVNNNGTIFDDGGNSSISYSYVQDMPGGENGNMDGYMYFGNFMFPGEFGGDFAPAYPAFAGLGNNSYYAGGQTPDLSAIVTDYQGSQRFYGTIDVGAVETTMLPYPIADANGIVYVKTDGLGDGTSWDNATNNIQDAMFAYGVQEIWVAKGVYTPTYTPDEILTGMSTGTPRDRTFLILPNIKIYGGFAGTETLLEERDLSLPENASILSGDLNGDDVEGNLASRMENSYHVVMVTGPAGDGLLDGFTISGGNADGSDYKIINGLTIQENSGGGMIIKSSSPLLNHLILKDNYGLIGAGMSTSASSTVITNSLFYNNTGTYGGAIGNWGSSLVITNVTITANQASYGAGIYNEHSYPAINNTIVYGNAGEGVHNVNSQPIWRYCLIQDFSQDSDWDVSLGVNGGSNLAVYTMYNEPVFNDPENHNYTLNPSSVALNSGDGSLLPGAATMFDLAGNARLFGPIDMGAYELLSITLCTAVTSWHGSGWTNGVPNSEMYRAEIFADYDSAIHGDITACSLVIHEGDVMISSGGNFIINGEVSVAENASLTVAHNANLIQLDGSVVNESKITVLKESAPMYRLDYAMWASPVAEQKLKAFSPQTLDNRFYTYNPVSDAYSVVQAPATTDFEPGKGYLIRVANNHTAYVSDDIAPTPWTGTFEGVPHNGDLEIPVVPASEPTDANPDGIEGYNAIGNPYPSSISVVAFFETNGNNLAENSPIYFWRKKNDAGTSSYCSLTLAGYNSNSGNSFGDSSNGVFNNPDNSQNWVINPGQGFIVKARSEAIMFYNFIRMPVNNGQMFRTAANAQEKSRLWLNLTNAEGDFGQTLIAYTSVTTLGSDYGWDGEAITDGDIAIYSFAGESKLGIQARPAFNVADEVPIGCKITTAGNHTIALDHFDGVFAEGQKIYLRDNLLGMTHNLETPYDFTADAGTLTGRFDVIYAEPLAVEKPKFNSNSIIVYKHDNAINISTGTTDMKSVSVYDIHGRLLYNADNINAAKASIATLQAEQQMLIVEVTTTDGLKASRKIVF